MIDTRSRTDRHRNRLQAARTQAIHALNRAERILEHEDPASPVTASFDPGSSSSSGTSPVEAAALGAAMRLEDHEAYDHTRDDPRRHLGRIVTGVEKHVAQLDQFVADLEATRVPDRPCDCCGETDGATHPPHNPRLCVRCFDFRRNNDGLYCSEAVHQARPQLRWCDCPLECCPNGCPDKAEEGRNLSARCRARVSRRRKADA